MRHQLHIRASILPAVWLLALWVLMLPYAAGQHTVSISNQAGCALSEVLVPVDVGKFNDVGTFTFYIDIDTAKVSFVAIENKHQALSTGNLESNLNLAGQILTITWYAMSPAFISSGKLFDIRVLLKESPALFSFAENCEIALSDLSIVENVVYRNGNLVAFSSIPVNPPTTTVDVGGTASFLLPLMPGIDYQWQENIENEWINLSEDYYYTGVLTHELSILSAPIAFNNRLYRCMLSNEDCNEATGEALLHVTQVGIGEQEGKDQKSLLLVYPNPAGDQITYIICVAVQHAELRLIDTNGHIVLLEQIANLNSGEQQTLNLGKLTPGIYMLQLLSQNKIMDSVKIIQKL